MDLDQPETPDLAPRTGVDEVDGAVVDIQQLDQRPLSEHVAAFESAHDRLRRALDPTRAS